MASIVKATVDKAICLRVCLIIFEFDSIAVFVPLTHRLLQVGAVEITAVVGHSGAATCILPIDAEVGQ